MPTGNRRLLPALTVALLIGLAWWLFGGASPERTASRETAKARTLPDYFMDDFVLRAANKNGSWRYDITGKRMVHLPRQGVWKFQSPEIVLFTKRGAPWYGTAPRGKAWNDGNDALLMGKVHFWRPASPANERATIDSSNVALRPNEDYAQTQALTIFHQGSARMQGVGARAYLDQQRIELLSQVRGTYVPQKH